MVTLVNITMKSRYQKIAMDCVKCYSPKWRNSRKWDCLCEWIFQGCRLRMDWGETVKLVLLRWIPKIDSSCLILIPFFSLNGVELCHLFGVVFILCVSIINPILFYSYRPRQPKHGLLDTDRSVVRATGRSFSDRKLSLFLAAKWCPDFKSQITCCLSSATEHLACLFFLRDKKCTNGDIQTDL